MKRYNPKEIEPRWQKKWQEEKTFQVVESDRPKKYIIDMFPYPSGAAMHVGHVRNFTISDVLSQYHRQKGYNVLHTMGWDTFGLPAENYAIKTGTPPAVTTKANIANFKHQLQQLGMSYDWSREINTSDPEYYRWTQWIFTKLFENKLAYQKESPQWWCPVDKTVLANEQVEAGKCWRCGNEVVKKNLKQWFFKITDYADRLLDATDDLDWPEKIKTMQKNWIGRSVGAEIDFDIDQPDVKEPSAKNVGWLTVFTTRPDTLFGATFIVIAPEHPQVHKLATPEYEKEVSEYVQQAAAKSEIERMEGKSKSGVFTGSYAISPLTQKKIPIWVADYVLGGYGTGAIMAVPAHDERDFEFAKKYDLDIQPVVIPAGAHLSKVKDGSASQRVNRILASKDLFLNEGLLINSNNFDGLSTSEAREEIVRELEKKNKGKEKVQYKIRDWLISRQRYWGVPIPIIHCPDHGAVAVPEKDLPVVLPEVESFEPTGNGSVLETATDWVNTTCPECGKAAKRETDTMDGYACSSWYFLRYTDPRNDQQAWDPAKANHWLPIDYYCGGDHAVSHLLYSRFWMYFFADQGWIEKTRQEPVGKLVYNGYIQAQDGQKMSKSKGNVVNPDDLIDQGYGADSLRLFEMFIAPYDQSTNWNTRGVPGTFKFLQRLWTMTQEFLEAEVADGDNQEVLGVAHRAIKNVSNDLDRLSFNTAVASLMEAVNSLYKIKATGFAGKQSWLFALESLVQLVAPFAPHIAEELWQDLGNTDSVHVSNWPVHDEKYLQTDTMTIVVQVNGKVRAQLVVASDTSKDDILAQAKAHDHVRTFIDGHEMKKEIYVPDKLVSLVV